jgi:hypothetical protein
MSAPLNGSQLASDQSFDCGKRRLVQLKLEQLEFEVVNLVLRVECGGQIAAPLGIVCGDRLKRRPGFRKGFAGHQGIGLPCGFEPRERLAERTLDIEQRRLVALLGRAQLCSTISAGVRPPSRSRMDERFG